MVDTTTETVDTSLGPVKVGTAIQIRRALEERERLRGLESFKNKHGIHRKNPGGIMRSGDYYYNQHLIKISNQNLIRNLYQSLLEDTHSMYSEEKELLITWWKREYPDSWEQVQRNYWDSPVSKYGKFVRWLRWWG